jgi:hypothetical protein
MVIRVEPHAAPLDESLTQPQAGALDAGLHRRDVEAVGLGVRLLRLPVEIAALYHVAVGLVEALQRMRQARRQRPPASPTIPGQPVCRPRARWAFAPVQLQPSTLLGNTGTLTTNHTSREANRARRAGDNRLIPTEFDSSPRSP